MPDVSVPPAALQTVCSARCPHTTPPPLHHHAPVADGVPGPEAARDLGAAEDPQVVRQQGIHLLHRLLTRRQLIPSLGQLREVRESKQSSRADTHWDTWPSPPDLPPATINHCLLNLPPAASLHTAAFVPPLTLSSSLADTTFLAACTPLSVLEHLAHPIFSRSP